MSAIVFFFVILQLFVILCASCFVMFIMAFILKLLVGFFGKW